MYNNNPIFATTEVRGITKFFPMMKIYDNAFNAANTFGVSSSGNLIYNKICNYLECSNDKERLKTLFYCVILHEFGHLFGLHHTYFGNNDITSSMKAYSFVSNDQNLYTLLLL